VSVDIALLSMPSSVRADTVGFDEHTT
jgi:hypothetical protein